MKILVCFTVTQDLDSVMMRDWEEANLNQFDISYTKRVYNCYDEAALETALQLKDQRDDVTIDAITIGNSKNDTLYKNLFAVGIRNIYQFTTEEDLRFVPEKVAAVLAAKAADYDVILTGLSSCFGDNGLTGYAIAHKLGIPCLGNIRSLSCEGTRIRVEFYTEEGTRNAIADFPAVFTVGNALHPYLRIATLREKLSVKDKAAIIEPVKLGDESSSSLPVRLYHEAAYRQCCYPEGATLEEKICRLYDSIFTEVEK